MRIILKILSSFGIGLLPFPGVWATLLGLGICYFFDFSVFNKFLLFTSIFIFGCILAPKTEKMFKVKDPHFFIIDEICGSIISVILIPHQPLFFILAFIIFRFLDNLKPFPLNHLGIMSDDLVAGLTTFFLIYPLSFLYV
ncbi:MAG: Phosphatidylglycerophosphatase [Microgenomates group bacterium GW2011_GWA2_40_6]|nr:MAG: Phosphatidylglycerophosphatase [Microgenomates group bacterium GW2011_GWA2_40_6]